jgi:hypothetical protein
VQNERIKRPKDMERERKWGIIYRQIRCNRQKEKVICLINFTLCTLHFELIEQYPANLRPEP